MDRQSALLNGKVALVTGGSRGLGKAIARLFAEQGATVAINYLTNQAQADEVVQLLLASQRKSIAIQGDVSRVSDVETMVNIVLDRCGPIDILVNNAGVNKPSPTLMETRAEDLDRMIAVNLKGVLHCSAAVAKHMIKRNYGRIVNLSSIAALGTAFVGTSGYAITKAGVIALTKRLAFELGPHNITVNAIAPGFIKTDMSLRDSVLQQAALDLNAIAQKTVLRRTGDPEDVANAALFFASDQSSFITGQSLTVDGGRIDLLTHSS